MLGRSGPPETCGSPGGCSAGGALGPGGAVKVPGASQGAGGTWLGRKLIPSPQHGAAEEAEWGPQITSPGFLRHGRGCGAGAAPSLSAPQSPVHPCSLCSVIVSRRKQLTKSHLKLLTLCCPACCSLLPSARAGKAPQLPGQPGLVLGACCRLYLPGDQQHPPGGLPQAVLSPTAAPAKGSPWHCHLSVRREGPEGFRSR